jgi:hypothetical protein
MLFGDAEAFCFRDCVAKMLSFVHHFSLIDGLIDKALSLVFDKRTVRQLAGSPAPQARITFSKRSHN